LTKPPATTKCRDGLCFSAILFIFAIKGNLSPNNSSSNNDTQKNGFERVAEGEHR